VTRARAVSAAIVAGAAAIAYAGVTGVLVATPDVAVATAPAQTSAQGSSALANPGTGGVSVASIARLPCDDSGMTIVSPAGAFAIPAGSQQPIMFDCPGTATFGMRRCTYQALSAAQAELGAFMGVCETAAATSLSASAPSLDFPNVTVGTTQTQSVTITNSGTQTFGTLQLQTTDFAGNVQIGAPCNPNANGCDVPNASLDSFTVDIVCRPSAVGTFASELHIVDQFGDRLAPLPITCTGSAAPGATVYVTTIPSPLDLGAVELLGGTATGIVRIANVGPSGTLTIDKIQLPQSDCTYTLGSPCSGTLPCALDAGTSVDVTVKLAPTTLGVRNATMTISSDDPANSQVAVRLHGVATGATLELAPGDTTTVDLGQVPKNGSASLQVHFANHGNRDVTDVSLALSGSVALTTNPVAPTSSFTVARGAAPTPVTLTCEPSGATGVFTTTLIASAADTVNNSPITITATCRGTDSQLDATPTSLQLGEVRVGTAPAPSIPFTLDNLSSSQLTLAQAPAIAPAVAELSLSGPPSLAIPGNGSGAVRLTIDPAQNDTLDTSITASDTSGTNTLAIPVTGKLVTANVTADATIDLGTFCVNEPTTPTAVRLASTGNGAVTLVSAQMASAPPQFAVVPRFPTEYPAQLVAGASATVDVSPLRTSTAQAALTDDLIWATDVDAPRTTLTAKFLASGAAIAPASLSFGPWSIHLYEKNAQPVTIQNCSGPTLSLHPSIDAPFSIDSDFPAQLVGAETATVFVGFHPTKSGMFTGHLHITTSAMQTLDIALAGIGSASGAPDDGGSATPPLRGTSFYACSCTSSGPGGVIPVGLALVCVLVPRRRRARAELG
jgi:uncharacterized protein (TIGR03382 family)